MERYIKKQIFKSYLRRGYSYFTITESGRVTTLVLWKEGESNKTISLY